MSLRRETLQLFFVELITRTIKILDLLKKALSGSTNYTEIISGYSSYNQMRR